ncbi:MAG TPA: prepilin-type N-terminal cleavage/methylation domain-containing protein [Candidatus Acidoferrales bacterium]|nr:prepilin-type N-terminal cleavage/methylation domain-containing protein [Candidatus Acidoferrales bacterium]
MRRQRGFTLAEVLVVTAIAFVAGWLLLRLVDAATNASWRVAQRLSSASAADRLCDRLAAQAAGAWSVFVPDADVAGNSNADGHEVDFATQDAAHRQHWSAFTFDARANRVTAYAYAPGVAPAAGEHFDNVGDLQATGFAVTALTDPAGPGYDPLFAGASASGVDVDFGWGSKATGGNHLVRVRLTGDGVARSLTLASATAPTHFTVVVEYTPSP